MENILNWQVDLQKEMNDPTIPMYTQVPEIPKLRSEWMIECLGSEHQTIRTISALLIQMGLDLHDRITENPVHFDLNALRKLQVDILAGDYYSSRFYRLLSRNGDLEAISRLCDGIIEVNQHKIRFYQALKATELMTWETYRLNQIQYRNALYKALEAFVPVDGRQYWSQGMDLISVYEWLVDEWDHIKRNDFWWKHWSGAIEYPFSFNLLDQLVLELKQFLRSVEHFEMNFKRDGLFDLMKKRITDLQSFSIRYADLGR